MNDIRKYYVYRALLKRFSLPVLVYHMSQVGINVEQIAQIGAIGYGAQLLLEFPTGALADKIGYRKTLIIAGVLNTVGLALFLGNSYGWFLASAITYWSGAAFRSGADSSLFYERLLFLGKEKLHRKILGNIRTVAGFVSLIFALLSGVAYQLHWSLPFIVSTAMAGLYSVLILTIGETNHKPDGTTSLIKNMQTALKLIRHNRTLLLLVLFQTFVFGSMLAVNEFNSALLEQVGIAAGVVGVIYALRHLLMAITGQIAARIDKILSPTLILVAIAVMTGTFYAGFDLFRSQAATATVLILVALPQTLLQVSYADYVNKLSDSKYRASISSATSLFVTLVLSVELFVIGFMSRFFELRTTLLFAGAFILIIGLITALGLNDEELA